MSLNFAYYCSGHGYGHATRVSALASQLLQLSPKPTVTIISEAPPHVFSDSMKLGAKYRNAKIDPVVQQPLAYRIDRKKSVDVLNAFLAKRESLVNDEVAWLKANKIHCVLSDAVFIACAAAHRAFLPSALVTNFTFDSIWSYLSAPLLEPQTPATSPHPPSLSTLAPNPSPPATQLELEPDEPIPHHVMDPLADQIARDYRNADLLLRLPGYLPFPSFSPVHPLPATDWIDPAIQRFRPSVLASLHQPAEQLQLYDSTPFPDGGPKKPLPRQLKAAPLLVRHPASDIYSREARQRLLDSIGIPREFQDPQKTKIVIVSFGGQVIKRPTHSRNGSRNLSMSGTPMIKPAELAPIPKQDDLSLGSRSPRGSPPRSRPPTVLLDDVDQTPRLGDDVKEVRPHTPPEIRLEKLKISLQNLPRIATPSHIYVPGAPPASNPASPILQRRPTFPSLHEMVVGAAAIEEELEPCLLPDGWIAIVCGVAKNWGEEDLPEGFFVAPRDVWMPDLTAVADVLLGKLGYGTCAECVDACTPFVYVPRPFFVEEHGLRELMESSGVGVLLPQERYELGDWAGKIEEAYEKGKFMKAMKRQQGWSDIRKREADLMARELVGWVSEWYELLDSDSTSGSYSLDSSTGIVGDVMESGESRTLQPQAGLALGLGGVPITA